MKSNQSGDNKNLCQMLGLTTIGYRSVSTVGVFLYMASIAMPLNPEIPLVMLSMAGIATVFSNDFNKIDLRSPVIVAMVIFLITTFLSILESIDVYRSFLICLSFLPGILIFYIIINQFNLSHLYVLCILFCFITLIIGSFFLFTALYHPLDVPSSWVTNTGLPFFIVPNDLIFLSIISPFLLVLFRGNSWFVRLFLIALFLLILGVIILFQSPIGLLVLMSTSFCLIGLLWPRRLLLSFLIFLIIGFLFDSLQDFLFIKKVLGTWLTRIPLWLCAWYMFMDAPFLGHGPNSFAIIGQSYLNKFILPSWIPLDMRPTPWVHNLYLEIAAERGLIGIFSFFLLLGVTWIGAWRVRNDTQSDEIRIYITAIIASFCGVFIAGLFELSFVRLWFVILLFILIALTQLLINESKQYGRITHE